MQQQVVSWTGLLTGIYSKTFWAANIRSLCPGWSIDNRLDSFKLARQLAIDIGIVTKSNPNLLRQEVSPTRQQLDQMLADLNGQDALSVDERRLLNPPDAYRYSPGTRKARIINATRHHEVEQIPTFIRDLQTLKQWFAYELPFGGNYADYDFFELKGRSLKEFNHAGNRIVKCVDARDTCVINSITTLLLGIQTYLFIFLFRLAPEFLSSKVNLPTAGFTICVTSVLTVIRHVITHKNFKWWHLFVILLDAAGKWLAYQEVEATGKSIYLYTGLAISVTTINTVLPLIFYNYCPWIAKQASVVRQKICGCCKKSKPEDSLLVNEGQDP